MLLYEKYSDKMEEILEKKPQGVEWMARVENLKAQNLC